MDFSLTKEQEMLKQLAAQFAEEELEPMAEEIDERIICIGSSGRRYGSNTSYASIYGAL